MIKGFKELNFILKMSLSNDKAKLNVTKSELESKIQSKKVLHYILRQEWKL